jgi:hypothetical protein
MNLGQGLAFCETLGHDLTYWKISSKERAMTDGPENLTLAYLRRLDGKLDQVLATQGDHGRRLTTLEIAVGNLAATELNHYANTALRMDQMSERIDRIERRLELTSG